MAKTQPITPHRGEVFLVALDPAVGAEIQKTRPALVLQNDTANRTSQLTIVAAITSTASRAAYVTAVPVSAPEAALESDSVILLNQIRTVDRSRLKKRLGAVSRETMNRVDLALKVSLGLVKL